MSSTAHYYRTRPALWASSSQWHARSVPVCIEYPISANGCHCTVHSHDRCATVHSPFLPQVCIEVFWQVHWPNMSCYPATGHPEHAEETMSNIVKIVIAVDITQQNLTTSLRTQLSPVCQENAKRCNKCYRVNSLPANVTQWTPSWAWQSPRKRRYFALLYVHFLEIWERERKIIHYTPKCKKKKKCHQQDSNLGCPGHRSKFRVLGAYFGDVNFDGFGQKKQNSSWDAHLGLLGFPKMYKSLL